MEILITHIIFFTLFIWLFFEIRRLKKTQIIFLHWMEAQVQSNNSQDNINQIQLAFNELIMDLLAKNNIDLVNIPAPDQKDLN